jgi:hypothetical protein
MNERERLQELHLALEGALEQLTRAHGIAAPTPAQPELGAIERLLGELTVLRNQARERLMKVLAKPTMTILK